MFFNVCRFCHGENLKLISLKNKQLIQLYERLFDTKLYCKDAKPKGFCSSCYENLTTMYEFSQKCIRSDRIFSMLEEQGLEATEENIERLNIEEEALPVDEEIPRYRA